MTSDPRLTPPNGSPVAHQVASGAVALREAPDRNSRLATQALHGEVLHVFTEQAGFGHVQCTRDGYVGWAAMEALRAPILKTTHHVSALRTYAFSQADLKSVPRLQLSRGARVHVEAIDGDYARCAHAGWVHVRHLRSIDAPHDTDPAAVAETYLHTPYLWGGRESLGLDCTGLTQQAFEAAGIMLPRDSDMQFNWCGEEIDDWQATSALQRNDLVFWKGHVGLMLDSVRMIHANAWHMAVAIEPLSEAIVRIKQHYAEPIGARRIDLSEKELAPAWR